MTKSAKLPKVLTVSKVKSIIMLIEILYLLQSTVKQLHISSENQFDGSKL